MLRHVDLVRTEVSDEISAPIIRVTRIICSTMDLGQKWDKELVVFLRSVFQLLLTAKVVSSSPILFTKMMKAARSSKTSVLSRTTRHNIPEGDTHYIQ
jgi:hypothetical protein